MGAWGLLQCLLPVLVWWPIIWNQSPALLKGPARDPLCLSWRPLALDGLEGGDVQGWARNGQQQEVGVCPGCLMMCAPCDKDKQEGSGMGTLQDPVTLF